jgi:hypothetical protein
LGRRVAFAASLRCEVVAVFEAFLREERLLGDLPCVAMQPLKARPVPGNRHVRGKNDYDAASLVAVSSVRLDTAI